MAVVRIAVASTPLTATLDEAVPAAVAAVEEAGRLGARIVCLPETGAAGAPPAGRDACPTSRRTTLDDAARRDRRRRARAPASSRSSAPSARRRPAARSSPSCSMPTGGGSASRSRRRSTRPRRPHYVAGQRPAHVHGRRPDVRHRDLPRGVPLPGDQPRARRSTGAQVVFVPHCVTTEDGPLPDALVRRVEPVQREGAACCRALENTVYVAQSNTAGPDQGSATCIVAPDGTLVAHGPTARSAWSPPTSTSLGRRAARAPLGAGAHDAADLT